MKGKERGFICECGKRFPFTGYVMAHWTADLRIKCDCGIKWSLEAGIAVSMDESDKVAEGYTDD